ncbi:hypothetical protein HDE70_005547 [Pedobacter cryoconitis]|nr:hypothetical protein [Pedobacter cryoconitis]
MQLRFISRGNLKIDNIELKVIMSNDDEPGYKLGFVVYCP